MWPLGAVGRGQRGRVGKVALDGNSSTRRKHSRGERACGARELDSTRSSSAAGLFVICMQKLSCHNRRKITWGVSIRGMTMSRALRVTYVDKHHGDNRSLQWVISNFGQDSKHLLKNITSPIYGLLIPLTVTIPIDSLVSPLVCHHCCHSLGDALV